MGLVAVSSLMRGRLPPVEETPEWRRLAQEQMMANRIAGDPERYAPQALVRPLDTSHGLDAYLAQKAAAFKREAPPLPDAYRYEAPTRTAQTGFQDVPPDAAAGAQGGTLPATVGAEQVAASQEQAQQRGPDPEDVAKVKEAFDREKAQTEGGGVDALDWLAILGSAAGGKQYDPGPVLAYRDRRQKMAEAEADADPNSPQSRALQNVLAKTMGPDPEGYAWLSKKAFDQYGLDLIKAKAASVQRAQAAEAKTAAELAREERAQTREIEKEGRADARQQAKEDRLLADRKEIEKYKRSLKGKGKGGGVYVPPEGSVTPNSALATIRSLAEDGLLTQPDTYVMRLRNALTMNSKDSAKEVASVLKDAGTEAKGRAQPEVNLNAKRLEGARQEVESLNIMLADLDKMDESETIPLMGSVGERLGVQAGKYILGGTGMSPAWTRILNQAKVAGQGEYKSRTGQVANVDEEREIALGLYVGTGTVSEMKKNAKKRLAEAKRNVAKYSRGGNPDAAPAPAPTPQPTGPQRTKGDELLDDALRGL